MSNGNVFSGAVNRIRSAFGYHVLEPRGRRRSVSSQVYREDHHTKGIKHRQLQSTAAELTRNLSLAAWMVRRHLDYVANFKFRSRNELPELDATIEQLMAEANRPTLADVARKFSREKLFRLAETRRVLDGDTLLIMLADGRLQGIQADLIRDPEQRREDQQWINGVQINGVGRPLRFGVYSREGYAGRRFVRSIRAQNCIHYGFFDRYATDQVRGISPMVTALAPLQDVNENFTYALAKAKVSQLLALAFYRESSEPIGDITAAGTTKDITGDEVGEPTQYKVDFGGGPQVFNLDPGDRAEFIESKTPATEFQSFTNSIIQVALKSLDLPYSFFDESHTNFFGSRAAWLHYERSCKDKRDDQIAMRRIYTLWKYRQWIAEGRLVLPAGMTLGDLRWEWVPLGMPWWDPSKEIAGQVSAIKSGLDTPQRITRAHGSDFYENVDDIAAAIEYARAAGVPLEFATDIYTGAAGLADQVDPVDESDDDDDSDDESDDQGDDEGESDDDSDNA